MLQRLTPLRQIATWFVHFSPRSKKLSEKPLDPASTGSQTGMERSIGTSTCGVRKPCLRAAAWLPTPYPLFRQALRLVYS
jgi:hypothetical protein